MLKDRIERLLEGNEETRDNDLSLLFNIWLEELPDYLRGDAKKVFAHLYGYGCSKPESVRRCRQSLQQRKPDLRGQKYESRQSRSREVVRAMKEHPGYGIIERGIV